MKITLKTHFWEHFDQRQALHYLWLYTFFGLIIWASATIFHLDTIAHIIFALMVILNLVISKSHSKWTEEQRQLKK